MERGVIICIYLMVIEEVLFVVYELKFVVNVNKVDLMCM